MPLTRTSVCPIFGGGKELSMTCLPTYEDVMQYCYLTRMSMKTTNKEPEFKDIAKFVIEKIKTRGHLLQYQL